MDASAVAERYFEAWNRRDPGGDRGRSRRGHLHRPERPGRIGAEATARYAGGLFAGFPDLAFEIESSGVRPDGSVAAQWLMTGTNAGPYQGCLRRGARSGCRGPTSSPSRATGSDRWSATSTPRSCRASSGSRCRCRLDRIGPFVFGTSTYVSTDGREPGAMSLTVLEARSPEEIQEVRLEPGR